MCPCIVAGGTPGTRLTGPSSASKESVVQALASVIFGRDPRPVHLLFVLDPLSVIPTLTTTSGSVIEHTAATTWHPVLCKACCCSKLYYSTNLQSLLAMQWC